MKKKILIPLVIILLVIAAMVPVIVKDIKEKNVDYETASDEQIEEACKKVAEQLFEEHCDWYED